MKRHPIYTLLFSTVLSAQLLFGATSVRPGLWEHTVSIKGQNGQMNDVMSQMNQQMASLPPEQRKMMEEMMAAQGVSAAPQGNAIRMCITKEEAQQNFVPPADGQCKQQVIQRSGNTMQIKFSCEGNPPSSGEGTYTFINEKAYTGNMTVRTNMQGRTNVIQMKQSGKWVSDNCGTIKPIR